MCGETETEMSKQNQNQSQNRQQQQSQNRQNQQAQQKQNKKKSRDSWERWECILKAALPLINREKYELSVASLGCLLTVQSLFDIIQKNLIFKPLKRR